MKSYFSLCLIQLATLLKWPEVMNEINVSGLCQRKHYRGDISLHSKQAKALVVSNSSKTDEYQEQKTHTDLTASLCFHSAVW